MKKSTIITILAFVLGIIVLAAGFILLTDNNISRKLFETTTTAPEPPAEPTAMDLYNMDMSQFVTLGEYKNMTIETEQIEVSDEELEMQIKVLLAINKEYDEISEGTISEKVIFNFDFEGFFENEDGTKGEAFQGGKGEKQLAYFEGTDFYTIGSSGITPFIDGFAQGINNKNVGETFDIHITFPENYSPEMAGKKTIFTVTINYIAQTKFTDEWVKTFSEGAQETCDEYREYVRKTVNDIFKESNTVLLWEKIMDNATVIEIPQQQIDYVYSEFRKEVENYAQMFGVTYEEFLKSGYAAYFLGINYTTEAEIIEAIKESLTYEIVRLAVVQAEGIVATDEEYGIMLETLVEQMGKTEEEVLQQYSEEYIRQQIVLNKLDGVVYDLNNFVLKTE